MLVPVLVPARVILTVMQTVWVLETATTTALTSRSRSEDPESVAPWQHVSCKNHGKNRHPREISHMQLLRFQPRRSHLRCPYGS